MSKEMNHRKCSSDLKGGLCPCCSRMGSDCDGHPDWETVEVWDGLIQGIPTWLREAIGFKCDSCGGQVFEYDRHGAGYGYCPKCQAPKLIVPVEPDDGEDARDAQGDR